MMRIFGNILLTLLFCLTALTGTSQVLTNDGSTSTKPSDTSAKQVDIKSYSNVPVETLKATAPPEASPTHVVSNEVVVRNTARKIGENPVMRPELAEPDTGSQTIIYNTSRPLKAGAK
jgi:hypothetical protein